MADITGTAGDDTLTGTGDPDTISGLGGNDTLHGLGGNDVLDGGSGNDSMDGGQGDDVYVVDSAGDLVSEAVGEGSDIIRSTVSYILAAGSEVEILSVADHGLTSAINLTGNALANQLWGNAGANVLNGAGGADVMFGFGGDDIYFVDQLGDDVYENAGQGSDIVYASASYALTGGSEVEILSVTDHSLTTGLALTGNEFGNELWGNEGANVLNGVGGADVMIGFGGDDLYYVDHAGDDIYESTGRGRDIAYSTVSYMLTGGSEVEILSAADHSLTTRLDLTGNELANELWGNEGVNVLNGAGGADVMIGFSGDDVYYVDHAGDDIYENAGRGHDIAYSTVSYTLTGGSEVEILSVTDHSLTSGIALTGNEFANELWGNAGANVLNGAGGADVMIGFGGDDLYYVDHAGDDIYENAGRGHDIAYSTVSYTLTGGSEVEILSAADHSLTIGLDLTGNELANELWGNNGVNVLSGGGGADVLIGFGGSDTLDGGDGADYLVGGAGADSFAFTSALGAGNVDTIADFVAGLDRILLAGAAGRPFSALASGTLAANAFLIGTAALDANDYLIYNSTTGALLYDADGVGGAAAVQFAALATGLSLTAADFLVSGPENTDPAITSGSTNSIPENSVVSTIVYQTVATDDDGDRITYTLTGADASLLTIDASGAVRLITAADFETKSSYLFNVVASDSEASTAKAIQLTITDVADGAPTPIINETGFPNDSTATAQFVNRNTFLVADNPNLPDDSLPSATIVGSISADSDKDFFSVTLVAGERLILDVDGTPTTLPGLDTHLRLYNPGGTEIGDNDDLGEDDPGSDPPYGHNTDSQILFRAPTDGTYYFSIESFEGSSNGSYRIHVSIAPPATPQQLLNEDIDALVSGAEWNHINLTYGFPASASQVPSSFSEVSPASDFSPFSSLQQIVTAALLQHISTVSSLTFTQSTATNGSGHLVADLRFAMSVEAEVAYAYYPTNGGVNSPGGSAWFNKTKFNEPAKGEYAWMGILHETGHALGLKHGHEFPIALSPGHDSTEFTVMTYRSYPGDNLSGGYSNEKWGYPQTLMMLDIAALQRMYGANFAHNAGDTVYSWSPTTGEFFVNGVGQGAPGNDDGLITPAENRIFMTLWDGNGVDTYDFSNYGTNLTIDLRPGEWTKTDDSQRANLGDGHFARGQIANALLHDGDARSLIENAIGGTGNDLITANQAANSLTGGGGADTFDWQEIGHVGIGAQADVLADFQSGQDKIDLRSIDATSASPATNDAFNFIGTGAFTNMAGQLRYQVEGSNVRVQGDVDGNGIADLEIVVNNIAILSSTDFFL